MAGITWADLAQLDTAIFKTTADAYDQLLYAVDGHASAFAQQVSGLASGSWSGTAFELSRKHVDAAHDDMVSSDSQLTKVGAALTTLALGLESAKSEAVQLNSAAPTYHLIISSDGTVTFEPGWDPAKVASALGNGWTAQGVEAYRNELQGAVNQTLTEANDADDKAAAVLTSLYRVYTVKPGDNLWTIAESFGRTTKSAQVAADDERIYDVSQDAVGADPNLIGYSPASSTIWIPDAMIPPQPQPTGPLHERRMPV